MNFFRRLSVLCAGLLFAAGAMAQNITLGEVHQTTADTIKGKAGKVILLKEYMGLSALTLAHNGRFAYGSSGDAQDDYSFIYELATGKSMMIQGVVGGVIDFENYVTTRSIVRNGVETEYIYPSGGTSENGGLRNLGAPIHASEDLNTIFMFSYIDQVYVPVVFNGEGQLIDTMPTPSNQTAQTTFGYGSLLWGISPDGQIGVGKSSVAGCLTNNQPAFWDRTIDQTFSLADIINDKTDGTLNSCSRDGRYMTGERQELTILVDYDRTAHTWKITEIAPEPGYGMGLGSDVEGDFVIGLDQLESRNVYSRKPWIYSISDQTKTFMDEYLVNLYGLDMEAQYSLFTLNSLNEEATVFTGTSYDEGNWLPYLIVLDEEQIHPQPRYITVRQKRNTMNVEIKWQAALKGDYEVSAYRIYCDNSLVATVDHSDQQNDYSYIQTEAEPGLHEYRMQAVYTDGKMSDTTESQRIRVVEAGGCLPVRDITAEVEYNRTVFVRWGMPTSDAGKSAAPAKIERGENAVMNLGAPAVDAPAPKYAPSEELDRISLFNTNIESASAAVRIGDYYYVTDFRNNAIKIFNIMSGARVATVEVSGLGDVYDVTYKNNVFYCVNNTNIVKEVRLSATNPFSLSLSNQWEVPEGVKLNHITYVEGENDGKDMLMLGSHNSVFFYNLNPMDEADTVSGFAGRFNLEGRWVCGSAYHNGRVYFGSQFDGGNTPFVDVVDFETGKILFTYDLANSFPELKEAASYPMYPITMAGLSTSTLEDGTVVLECMAQPYVTYNHVAAVEIESAPDVLGYNVYRNKIKVNEEPLKARHYKEAIYEPGEYTYMVEFVSTTECTQKSDSLDNPTVEINPIGTCDAPGAVKVVETNRMASITWELPEHTDGFVCFNIYRDREKIAGDIVDVRYIDRGQIEKGKHIYRVEAFYDNSCAASDSMEIEFTFEGRAMPPAAVAVKGEIEKEGTCKVTTSWELPFFEDPMTLGYCDGMPAQGVGFPGSDVLYGAIGWVAEDMGTFDDLYLVGLEFVLGMEVPECNAVVWVDNKMVYNEPADFRQRPQEWTTVYLNKSFPMKQEKEIAVGYRVRVNEDGDRIFGFDAGPCVEAGKTDLISPDGVNFYSAYASQVNANLCINALVVRKRDLEQASKENNPQAYIEEHVMRISSEGLNLTSPQPIAPVKSTSEAYTLKGFNVYCDGKKLNEEILTGFSLVENGKAIDEYEYQVGAVYADGEELSESVFLTGVANRNTEKVCPVAFYPNPVQNTLGIQGEYESLQVLDLTGRMVMDNIRNTQSIDMSGLQSGVYFINLTTAQGGKYTVKIVKR